MSHKEHHKSHRVGWLRAAVLGANDGIVSTASLIIGVAAASTNNEGVLLAGVAGLVAGAMSMAAGEYVSVSSQSDTENADLAIEKKSLEEDFKEQLSDAIKQSKAAITPNIQTAASKLTSIQVKVNALSTSTAKSKANWQRYLANGAPYSSPGTSHIYVY